MATSYDADWAGDLAAAPSVITTRKPVKAGFFKRFYAAMIASRQRTAEREIERYIAARGGVITDQIERELSRSYGAMPHKTR
jgi:hypothetical protein